MPFVDHVRGCAALSGIFLLPSLPAAYLSNRRRKCDARKRKRKDLHDAFIC